MWYSPLLLSAHSAVFLTVDIPCVLPSSANRITVFSTMRHPERAQALTIGHGAGSTHGRRRP